MNLFLCLQPNPERTKRQLWWKYEKNKKASEEVAKYTPQRKLTNCMIVQVKSSKIFASRGSKYMIRLNVSYSNIKLDMNLKWQHSSKIIPCALLVPE